MSPINDHAFESQIMPTDAAQSVVEFAIVLPTLLLIATGTIVLARMMLAQQELMHAAWEGARAGATLADPSSGDSEIVGAVSQALFTVPESCIEIEIDPAAHEWPRTGPWPLPRGHSLTVQVACLVDVGFPFGQGVLLQSTAVSRMEYENP